MNINTNIYKQYINSGGSYNKCTQNTFSIHGKKTEIKQDSLSFSAEASLLRANGKVIKESAADIVKPASDERINSLKQQIASGEYNVSANNVADSILNRWI